LKLRRGTNDGRAPLPMLWLFTIFINLTGWQAGEERGRRLTSTDCNTNNADEISVRAKRGLLTGIVRIGTELSR